jgi:hypothetical protein
VPLAKDVVVTGLPRSGLTLACALIDQLPDAVCLNAPQWHTGAARKFGSNLAMCKWLVGEYLWTRKHLIAGNPVPDVRREDGLPFTDGHQGGGKEMQILKPGLTDNFILGFKHHLIYTSMLPQLVEFDHFRIIVIIRHPVEIIASWQKLDPFFLTQETPPGIMNMWPEAYAIATSEIESLDRFSQLYELFATRYYELREHIEIVKYEDIIDDPMMISRMFGIKQPSDATALIEPPSMIRNMREAEIIRASLKKYAVATKYFYPDL